MPAARAAAIAARVRGRRTTSSPISVRSRSQRDGVDARAESPRGASALRFRQEVDERLEIARGQALVGLRHDALREALLDVLLGIHDRLEHELRVRAAWPPCAKSASLSRSGPIVPCASGPAGLYVWQRPQPWAMKIALPAAASPARSDDSVRAAAAVTPSFPQPASSSTVNAATMPSRRSGLAAAHRARVYSTPNGTRAKQPSAPGRSRRPACRSRAARPRARRASRPLSRAGVESCPSTRARPGSRGRSGCGTTCRRDRPGKVQPVTQITEQRPRAGADRVCDVTRAAEAASSPTSAKASATTADRHERQASRREREAAEPQAQHGERRREDDEPAAVGACLAPADRTSAMRRAAAAGSPPSAAATSTGGRSSVSTWLPMP